MMNGKPADRSEVEAYPKIERDVGYNPARFLDMDLVETGDATIQSNRALVRAVIRGLQSVATVRAWDGVERNLARKVYDREPRQPILDWLAEREAELQERGDLDERLEAEDIPPREERCQPRSAADYDAMSAPTPMPESYRLWGTPSERLAEKARARAER